MLSRLDLPHKLWYVVWRALIGHLVLSNRSERSKQTWCTFTWEIFFVGSSHDFLQKWAITGLFFVYFRVFKQTIFTTNKCEKCPSSIQCWDSNPRPSEHESPPNNHKAMAPTLKMIKPRFGQTGLIEPCDCSKKVSTSRHLIDKESLPRRWTWRRRLCNLLILQNLFEKAVIIFIIIYVVTMPKLYTYRNTCMSVHRIL